MVLHNLLITKLIVIVEWHVHKKLVADPIGCAVVSHLFGHAREQLLSFCWFRPFCAVIQQCTAYNVCWVTTFFIMDDPTPIHTHYCDTFTFDWDSHFARQPDSGLGVKKYCARNRVKRSTWYHIKQQYDQCENKSNFTHVKHILSSYPNIKLS